MSESRSEFEAWWDELLPGSNYTRGENYDCSASEAITIWQASRRAALEEAAKVCESAIDRQEAKRTEDRIRAAIATKDTDDELRALRHASSVGLHNGALERAAAAIRELAGKTKEGQEP